MFDFKIIKDGSPIIERFNVAPQVVIAALQILSPSETLTVSFSSKLEKS